MIKKNVKERLQKIGKETERLTLVRKATAENYPKIYLRNSKEGELKNETPCFPLHKIWEMKHQELDKSEIILVHLKYEN